MTAKKGNLSWLSAFIAFDVAILLAVLAPQLRLIATEPEVVARAASSLLAPPALLLLSSLIPNHVKASLVFWRGKFALPGHRAFSHHAYGDPRIDTANLSARISPYPVEATEQNSTWYRIYRSHRDDAAVLDANRRFLLFRDLAVVSILLAVLLPIVVWLLGLRPAIIPTLIVFVAQYAFSAIAARQAGERLVTTVLAIESTAGSTTKHGG
ncbi:hypothetical protein [Xanthomonas hortorum]|uniref:Uncharacterized protein n=1 Tax=Xanthomonas hortorum pv. hederae TaxID=453603 RepID=A0A9X4BTP6_9XANT|nr:hypothetical protein [Xanthomonas hortorum]MDC8639436.1 hypothetical protein [Xanthomonas hortorum pv. hederae]